jgi:biopolymer transport protein ExbD
MNLRKSLREDKELYVASLNDILFILLFFFLIIATLANPNLVKVSVPKGTTDSKAKQTVVVSVDSLHHFYVGTTQVPEDSLQAAIAAAVAKSHDPEPTVVINGDRRAEFDHIMAVIRAANTLRLRTVVAVDKEKQ